MPILKAAALVGVKKSRLDAANKSCVAITLENVLPEEKKMHSVFLSSPSVVFLTKNHK